MKKISELFQKPFVNHGYQMLFDKKGNHLLDCEDDNLMQFITCSLNDLPIPAGLNLNINLPVKYQPTKVIDGNGVEIISIRGWGRLQKLDNGDKVQDEIGQEIAELINLTNTHKDKTK